MNILFAQAFIKTAFDDYHATDESVETTRKSKKDTDYDPDEDLRADDSTMTAQMS